MGRLIAMGAAGAALLAGGGAGFLLADRSEDEPARAITIEAAPAAASSQPDRLLVDDGIAAPDARAAAERAAAHVQGKALSIDVDDGRYEVEVQRPDGAIVEVLLDRDRVVSVDSGD